MENNLLNVTRGNPAFPLWARRALGGVEVPRELEPLGERLEIVAGDSFFLHYTISPLLRGRNEDAFLDAVLAALKKYVERRDYRRARAVTVYDELTSLIFSRRLLKHLLEELKKVLEERKRQQSERGQPAQTAGTGPAGGGAGEERKGGGGASPQGEVEGGRQVEEDAGGGKSTDVVRESEGGERAPAEEGNQGSGEGGERGEGDADSLLGLQREDVVKAFLRAAEQAVEDALTTKRLELAVGGRKAGKLPAPLERLVNLADSVLEVEWARHVLAFADAISVPHFVRLAKSLERVGDEVAGYRRTVRVERALPRELALEDDLFFAKLACGGFLSREYYVTREGAYYVLLDRSGSMKESDKLVWSRSVALALFKLARQRGREFLLRFFDAQVHPLLRDPVGVVEHLLTVSPSGGTRIDLALRMALEELKRFKGLTSTIVIITDGEDSVRTQPEELARAGVQLVAVMTQGHNDSLAQLCIASGGDYLFVRPDALGGQLVVDTAAKR